jgi:hypothetical protein
MDSAYTSRTVAYWAKSLGISRCDGRNIPMVAQPLRELSHASLWSFFRGDGCVTIGKSQPSQRDMPMI